MAAYNVAKAGVVALSETLAAELAGSGVSVTVACPTFVKTDIAKRGHYANPRMQTLANRMVDRGVDASALARDALSATERGSLYCVPMMDGRWMWRLKRALPWLTPPLYARFAKRVQGSK
jgi:short-subunit dehydrogenase